MKVLLAMAGVLTLAACAGVYDASLDKMPTARFEAPVNKADTTALQPYEASSYFGTKRN